MNKAQLEKLIYALCQQYFDNDILWVSTVTAELLKKPLGVIAPAVNPNMRQVVIRLGMPATQEIHTMGFIHGRLCNFWVSLYQLFPKLTAKDLDLKITVTTSLDPKWAGYTITFLIPRDVEVTN